MRDFALCQVRRRVGHLINAHYRHSHCLCTHPRVCVCLCSFKVPSQHFSNVPAHTLPSFLCLFANRYFSQLDITCLFTYCWMFLVSYLSLYRNIISVYRDEQSHVFLFFVLFRRLRSSTRLPVIHTIIICEPYG